MFQAMSNAHERKKQPDLVRRSLLDCAARISLDQGLSSLTLQAVADAADVTKGGLLHHFRSKQALVEAVFQDLLDSLDGEIDRLMGEDPQSHGRFTRAYIRAFAAETENGGEWGALTISSLTDPALKAAWATWFGARLARHAKTDGGSTLAIARYAADGLWLADLMQSGTAEPEPRQVLIDRLLALTFPKEHQP
jgi:AcrR family transcriptional regulator